MAITSTINFNVQIPSGPNFTAGWNITADSYSRATVTIPNGLKAGAGGTTLTLEPATPNALLLVLTSTDYSGNVTYNFGNAAWALSGGPQIIAGAALANALSLGATIVFDTSNAAVKSPVTVDVLVLRTAVS